MDRNTYLALNQLPKKPIKCWQIKQGSQVLYENVSIQLCYYFTRTHGLNITPKAKY